MTAPPDLPRKVQQLNNDVDAIYEIVHGIQLTQGRHGLRLAEIVDAQVAQGTTLAEHAAVLHRHTSTLAGHTAILDQHTSTLAEHTNTLAEHTATLAEHTATLAEHGSKLDRIIALLESR